MTDRWTNKQDNDKKRIALVTGANRGIGFEVCKQLAQLSNMFVILTARNFEKGQSATSLLKDKGMDAIFYQLDVSNNNDIKNISLQIEQQYGTLDVLVNNAAIL
jgi:NAD(P)-dependent dehydrogenase (short-subunit alcohol dehydrogenase family)